MAQVVMTLRAETDLITDAVADLARLHDALSRRHGDRFRALERRIEDLLEGRLPLTSGEIHNLGECLFLVEPPPELVTLIATGRALGVI